MVMETTLPNPSPKNDAHSGLEPPDDVRQTCPILQLHQPMHMIWHYNKGQSLNSRYNSGFMHCPNHTPCCSKFCKNRRPVKAYYRKQIDLPGQRKPSKTEISAMRPIFQMHLP